MLLKGLNHVAVLTNDADRLNAFYREVFDAEVVRDGSELPEGGGPAAFHHQDRGLGGTERLPDRGQPRGRPPDADVRAGPARPPGPAGRLPRGLRGDPPTTHGAGAADDFVTDFGPMLSIFFRDPDGLECEVCVENPDAVPGVGHPPGTRAARFA